jgi:hypothetical protein
MASLKALKLKNKEFIFKSFGNDKTENPAKVIFSRFPLPDETFPIASKQNVLESNLVKNFDNSDKAKEQLVEHIIDTLISNLTAQRVDYKKFFETCVSHIENLEYEGKEMKTISDFFALPEEAYYQIAMEAYLYSKDNDLFKIAEKKI